jgi:hypothetical protein
LKNIGTYYFRSVSSVRYIKTIIEKRIPLNAIYFEISNGIDRSTGLDLLDSYNNVKNSHFIPNKSYTRIPQNWPCRNRSKQDCGYRNNFVRSMYFLTYNDNNFPKHNDVSDFVMSLTTQNLSNKITEYSSIYNTSLTINLSQLFVGEIEFLFSVYNIYSLETLSKVTEYKVKPIMR